MAAVTAAYQSSTRVGHVAFETRPEEARDAGLGEPGGSLDDPMRTRLIGGNKDRHAGGPDLLQGVRLGRAVDREVAAELALQPERGGYIGGAVGEDLQRELTLEHWPNSACQVVGRRRLPARAIRPRAAHPFAVRLRAERRAAQIATPFEDLPSDSKLEDTALPRVAASMGAGTLVASSASRPPALTIIVWPLIRAPGHAPCGGRDAVAADPLDQPLGRVEASIARGSGWIGDRDIQLIPIANRPDVAGQGAGQTNDGVRVDQAERDDDRFRHFDAVGESRLVRGADPFDRAARADDHDGVLERLPGYGVEESAGPRQRRQAAHYAAQGAIRFALRWRRRALNGRVCTDRFVHGFRSPGLRSS